MATRGGGAPTPAEEARLRGEVLLHGAVVVEMVLGEIGEDGDIDGQTPDALLLEGVAGHLHDGFGCAEFYAIGKEFENVARLRRGVGRGADFVGDVGLDGSDENAGAAYAAQHRFEEEGGGRLAVGAGYGAERERALGMAHDRGGDLGEGAASMLDQRDGDGGVLAAQAFDRLRASP